MVLELPVLGERGRMSLMREFVTTVNEQIDERVAEVGDCNVRRELRAKKTDMAKNAVIAARYSRLLCAVQDKMAADVKRR
jgi:hypothetical protein